MKRLSALILMLVMILSLTSSSIAETNVYTDSELGIQFAIPEGWEIVPKDDWKYSSHEDIFLILETTQSIGGTIELMYIPDKKCTRESVEQFKLEDVKKAAISGVSPLVSPKIIGAEKKKYGSTTFCVVEYTMISITCAQAVTTVDGGMILLDLRSLLHFDQDGPDFYGLLESFTIE